MSVLSKIVDIQSLEKKTRADILLKVVAPPNIKISLKKQYYVLLICGDMRLDDIYDPSNEFITVFIWIGNRDPVEFEKVKEGMLFYGRRAMIDEKLHSENEVQVKCYDDSVMTFFDKIPHWAEKFE